MKNLPRTIPNHGSLFRASLPEWAPFASFSAEVQVRTVLQHAWAEIDHKLRYKTEAEVPHSLRRKLFRISALLELADDEFASLHELAVAKRVEYEERIEKGELALAADLESLLVYLRTSPRVAQVGEAADGIGFRVTHPSSELRDVNLFGAVRDAGLSSIEQLDRILEAEVASSGESLRRVANAAGEAESPIPVKLHTLVRLLLFLSLSADRRSDFVAQDRVTFRFPGQLRQWAVQSLADSGVTSG